MTEFHATHFQRGQGGSLVLANTGIAAAYFILIAINLAVYQFLLELAIEAATAINTWRERWWLRTIAA